MPAWPAWLISCRARRAYRAGRHGSIYAKIVEPVGLVTCAKALRSWLLHVLPIRSLNFLRNPFHSFLSERATEIQEIEKN